MVDAKRVEKKLPLLITEAPWYSYELDQKYYQLKKFKKQKPDQFNFHKTKIMSELEALDKALEQFKLDNKSGKH